MCEAPSLRCIYTLYKRRPISGGCGGVRSGKKYLKVKVFFYFTRLCYAVCLTFRLSGNNRVTKIKKLWGYTIENDYHLHYLTREVISCPCLTHTVNHLPTYPPTYFFAVLLDRLNALAVGAPFDPGLRIRSPLPAAIRLRFF